MRTIIRYRDGLSAKTINDFFHYGTSHEPSIPYDPSDFRRCYNWKIINNYNHKIKWQGLLNDLADKYPIWKPTAFFWDTFEELYLEETKNETEFGKAPKLYKAMNEAKQKYDELLLLKDI